MTHGSDSLAALMPELGWLLPFLLAVQAGGPVDPQLVRLGLAHESGGLTKKGVRVLEALRGIADLLDLPLA